MRKDIEREYENCTLGQARSTAGKKGIARLQSINVGIRISKVAADIQKFVTRAKASIPKYIPVLKDYFKEYVVCLPLERTIANASRAIAENWILTFGAPDCLHANQRANFCSEQILEVCSRSFRIEMKRKSPYHPRGNGMVEHHNRVTAYVISKYCANNQSS